jgi:hypothetical protein
LFTACGCVYFATDRNDYSCIFSLENGTEYVILETDSDGTRLFPVHNNGGLPTAATLVAGEWYFWCIRRSTTTDLTADVYRYSTGAWTQAVETIAAASFTPNVMYLGNDSYGEWFDGRHAAFKLWNNFLSLDEVKREAFSIRPVRTTDLLQWTPAVDSTLANVGKDYSGNGRDWTQNGTLSVEDGPPVPWGAEVARVAQFSSPPPPPPPGGSGAARRRRLLTGVR